MEPRHEFNLFLFTFAAVVFIVIAFIIKIAQGIKIEEKGKTNDNKNSK